MAMYRFNLSFREAHCPQSYPQRNPQSFPLQPKGVWKTTAGRGTSNGKVAGPKPLCWAPRGYEEQEGGWGADREQQRPYRPAEGGDTVVNGQWTASAHRALRRGSRAPFVLDRSTALC